MKTRKEINEIQEAVFLIDMNVGFCEKGNLADPSIKAIVPNIIPIIDAIMRKGEGFFVVNDAHNENSVELKRYAGHCHNEEESRTIKELAISQFNECNNYHDARFDLAATYLIYIKL